MLSNRLRGAASGALLLLVLSSCVDSNVVQPDADTGSAPALAIVDGSTGGNPNFFLLPPLAEGSPTISGEFNPFLRPSVRVCVVDEVGPGLNQTCDGVPANRLAAEFEPGSIDVQADKYQISWDTGDRPIRYSADDFLLLEVLVGDLVLGSIQLDPQNPQGPGQSTADAYPFRIGENIPVKFWLSEETLCTGDPYVQECITGAVIDQTGGTLALEDEGNRLGVVIYANSLPAPYDEVTVTVERIDPVVFFNVTGQECLPGIASVGSFDAPQFGDCFRVLTNPVLPAELEVPALVSICLDPNSLAGLDLTLEQEDQLTMVRFNDGATPSNPGDDTWEALADAFGDCPTQSAALLDVPDSGFLRYAAMGVNALASMVGPEEVEARDLRLGGLTSSFSQFRYALPGQMVPTDGNGVIIQSSDPETIDATVNVVDHEGLPVENAVVHFSTPDGTLSAPTATSDVGGNATIQWTVDTSTPGDKTLTASALGLTATAVPEHDANYFFAEESVAFTATVVGPPAALGQDPDSNIDDAVAGSPQTLTVVVTDADGNLVEGAVVTWTCTPTCVIPETSVSDDNGVATVEWTPQTAGSQASVATIGIEGVPDAVFTATVAPAEAVEPLYPTPPSQSTAGLVLDEPLVITVTDEFGNPRVGDVVTWSIVEGGGRVSSASTPVLGDGTATVDWTLGEVAGPNALQVSVGTFSATLNVTGSPGDPVQPEGTGSGQNGVVDASLTNPLSVTVADQFGNAIQGVSVNWSGDGAFSESTSTTDAAGVASTVWTLGTTAGAQTATASVSGFTVDFTAEAAPGDPATLVPTGGGVTQVVASVTSLSVLVTDAFGNVVPDQDVTWSGDGLFSPTLSTTDGNGLATTAWTLGSTSGPQGADATLGGLSVGYTATALADIPASIATSGGSGEYDGGSALPLSIIVTDQYGNAREGDPISWSATSGSISSDPTTGAGGVGNAVWTLGTEPGDATATAMVGLVQATFEATIRGCVVTVDGVVDVDEWSCALEDGDVRTFAANISGGSTPAEIRWQQRADSVYFLVRVQQSSLARRNSVRIDFDNTLDGPSGDDDAIGFDENNGFFDEYLTNRCVNRGQSGCGSTDSNGQDGAGALANDGVWTVYELSHPLDGDGLQDVSRTEGQSFGIFLSLTNGNGAQGNTQFPGFRQYLEIVVR